MTHPKGTAYQYDLYKLKGLPESSNQALEERFMRRVDQLASDALHLLIHGSETDLTTDLKSGWARFILSLVHRHPEKVSWIGVEIAARFQKRLTDASALEKAKALLLLNIIDSQNVGSFMIERLNWFVVKLLNPKWKLLTSDRPIVMTNGVGYPTSYLMLPIDPTHLFIAVPNFDMEWQLRNALEEGHLVEHVNRTVASQAKRYVYYQDDSVLPFVEGCLGRGRTQFVASPAPAPVAA